MLLKLKIWIYISILKHFYGYKKVSVNLLYAQAKHETGNFKSEVFKQNKNLFGMREPKKRKTKATGTNLHHAVFKTHFESIIDYFLRQNYFKIPDSDDRGYMINTVKSGYAEDKEYLKKWQTHSNTDHKPPLLKFLVYGGIIFFFLISLIFIFKIKKSNNKNYTKK